MDLVFGLKCTFYHYARYHYAYSTEETFIRLSSNRCIQDSEANASELLENLEDILPRY